MRGDSSSELRPTASPTPLGSSKLAGRVRCERFVSHLGEQIRDRLDCAGRAVGVPVDIVANRRARQDENVYIPASRPATTSVSILSPMIAVVSEWAPMA